MKRKSRLLHVISVSIVAFFLVLAYGSKKEKEEVDSTPPPALGTIERAGYEINKIVYEGNRGVEKISNLVIKDGDISMVFGIDENLSDEMIIGGSKMDLVGILKGVKKSGIEYNRVIVWGYYPLVDKYGNSEDEEVFEAIYKKSTIDKINWNGFIDDNIFDIADKISLHSSWK